MYYIDRTFAYLLNFLFVFYIIGVVSITPSLRCLMGKRKMALRSRIAKWSNF